MRKQLLITLGVAAIGVASYAADFIRVKTVDGKIIRYKVKNVVEVDFEDEFIQQDTTSVIPQDTTSVSNYTCVDLGLTSGNLWASYNIGATKPEEYGTYFAWGETKPKEGYDWNTYKYATTTYNASWDEYDLDSITKYIIHNEYGIVNSLATLLPEDDAATVNWGSAWRMPTNEEQMELLQECEHSWTEVNGVYGAKFTGKNGNSVFFPAAGGRYSSEVGGVDEYGCYWSSSFGASIEGGLARYLYFLENRMNMNSCLRYRGFPVRAVRAKRENKFYAVNFYTSDSILIESQRVKEGDSAKEIKAPAKPGYEFVGWNTLIKNVYSDISVYAIYKEAYIDLGLPSGTKWATVNIGAIKPEEFGDYFAWGETKPKNVYDWSTYKYATTTYNSSNGEYEFDSITKYRMTGTSGGVDSLSTLLPEDDAATANWGSEWRMPTYEEQHELFEECEYCWTEINGVYGAKFTGPNGNSVFFPAAGHRDGSDAYDVGDYGYYWASSLTEELFEYNSYNMFLDSKDTSWEGNFRSEGVSVRAVRAK